MRNGQSEEHLDLDIIFAALASLPEATEPAVTDETLVRMACGVASEEEIDAAAAFLVTSPEARERLLTLRAKATNLSQSPLMAQPTEPDDVAIADCLRAETASFLTRPVNAWRQIVADLAEAWTLAIRPPSLALYRSGEQERPLTLAPGLPATLKISLQDQDLVAQVTLTPGGTSVDPFLGRSLFLLFRGPAGDRLPLATANLAPEGARFVVSDFLDFANVEPEGLNVDAFESGFEPEAEFTPPVYLTASVSPDLPGASRRAVPIEIRDPARVDSGKLTISVALPAVVRSEFPEASLELALKVGALTQRLGQWPISGWTAEPRRLEVPVPDVSSGDLRYPSLLRLRITPSSSI